jgi:hypothetical protein
MSSFLRRLQKAPAFPLFPFVPLVMAGSLMTLSLLTFARVMQMSRQLETALRTQRGGATA